MDESGLKECRAPMKGSELKGTQDRRTHLCIVCIFHVHAVAHHATDAIAEKERRRGKHERAWLVG